MGKRVNPSWTDPSVQQFYFALLDISRMVIVATLLAFMICLYVYQMSLLMLEEQPRRLEWQAMAVGIETKAKPTKHSHM